MQQHNRFLFFDTETSALPARRDAPVTDLANWPRIVQLAWKLCERDGTHVAARSHIVRPEGFLISPDAVRVHGITQERAEREGAPVREALEDLAQQLPGVTLVAHNMEFDARILGAEFLRNGMGNPLDPMKKICTMRSTVDFCRLPGKKGYYKWPRLEELHRALFGTAVEGAHDAAMDVEVCARCFFELRRRNVL